jgi:hypothetical protein|tara:strand:+ start:891 stop:1235 length:345 start_codon:yes stop_codon:yes gene_type:complete
MDNLVWIIYFIDVFSVGSGIIMLLSLSSTVYVYSLFYVFTEHLEANIPHKMIASIWMILFLYAWIVPSKDTAYKMLAAYGVTELAQNEQAQKLGGKSLEVLNAAMDNYLKSKEK